MNAIITGATKGIGRATAELFAKNGWNLYLAARSSVDLANLQQELKLRYPHISVFIKPCDLSIQEQVHEFADACLKQFNSVEVLMNNAGIFEPGNIHEEREGLLEEMMDINLFSAYYLSRKIIPCMIKNQNGHIFNMCSVASLKAYDQGGSYAITKSALHGFSKNLRHELKSYGIRVTSILAGATLTDSWEGTSHPEERFIPAEDIATLIFSAYSVSGRTVVEEILVRPLLGDI
jgi:short-subunit dehydrogenase